MPDNNNRTQGTGGARVSANLANSRVLGNLRTLQESRRIRTTVPCHTSSWLVYFYVRRFCKLNHETDIKERFVLHSLTHTLSLTLSHTHTLTHSLTHSHTHRWFPKLLATSWQNQNKQTLNWTTNHTCVLVTLHTHTHTHTHVSQSTATLLHKQPKSTGALSCWQTPGTLSLLCYLTVPWVRFAMCVDILGEMERTWKVAVVSWSSYYPILDWHLCGRINKNVIRKKC